MKKETLIRILKTTLITSCILSALQLPVAIVQAKGKTVEVETYGAKAGDSKDDTKAIQVALNLAKTASGTTTIKFKAGTYLISSPLHIYSNTYLKLDPNTVLLAKKKFNKGKGGTLLYATHVNSHHENCYQTTGCQHKGYNHTQNVIIENGIFDGNSDNRGVFNNAIIFRHGNKLTIKGTTFRHFTRHVVNIGGSANVTISGAAFRDCDEYTGTSSGSGSSPVTNIECIHFDFIAKDCENAYPVDNTPPKNIVIENCVFDHIAGGVGTHHGAVDKKKPSENIKVMNCTFGTMKGSYCVGLGDCTGAVVTGNTYPENVKMVRAFSENCVIQESENTPHTGDIPLPEPNPTEPAVQEEPAAQTLTVTPGKSVTLNVNKSKTLKVKAVPAGKVKFSSSNSKVATVSKKGVVKAKKKGTAKITVSCNGVTRTITVKVK